MLDFIIGIIVVLIGLAWVRFGYISEDTTREYGGQTFGSPSKSYRPWGWVGVGLGLLLVIGSCFTVVHTRAVGVPTSFSKPTGDTYGSGLHFKAPWVNVTDIDATIQPEEYKGDDCIQVKIADGGTACVSVSYRWRINPDHADEIFADYRNSEKDITDTVRSALVSTNIKAALVEVLGSYNPLNGADIRPNMSPEELANVKVNIVPDYEQINADVKANVEQKIAGLGGMIEIESITVSGVALPEATQDRINAFNQAVQETKIALQEVATKEAQARGNEQLAKSLQDPNVLVSECLDALSAGDFEAPAGFSCWPGAGGGVVIPGVN
jgi:regulator of protease activity HflC (stomatin/prohibitin superfamily)